MIDGIALITVDAPPVNALGHAVRQALDHALETAMADAEVSAIVLTCGGRTFFAGADINEFGAPRPQPDLPAIVTRVDKAKKPIVAAIHGTALGGGCELALACSWRVAVPSAKLGLPEVTLGILPGAGGTQRLPRLVGPKAALEMITSGKPVSAARALELGALDALVGETTMIDEAVEFARGVIGKPLRQTSSRQDKIAEVPSALFDEFRRENKRLFIGLKAPEAIVEAIQAAVTLSFDEGLKRERELFAGLEASRESAAQRHLFFAERLSNKVTGIPASCPTLPICKVGVVGAGTMGGGITMNFLAADIPVTLVETDQQALDRGIGIIRRNYENAVKKGRLAPEALERYMALITPALTLDTLGDADLVIEAIFEQLELKKALFAKLDSIVRPGAIVATNTSFLDVDAIAASTSRPGHVVGLHFFSPANVMRLLEVVRGAQTTSEVVATSMKLAKTIGKVPVLSGVCHGFIANRVMSRRSKQAEDLVLEGPSPERIDRVIEDFGFAMGPFRMADLVGLDVTTRGSSERSLRADLVAAGRLGQKNGQGFYDYDEHRRATPSPTAAALIETFAAHRGVNGGMREMSDYDILAHLLFPVINEGARVLEEGVAQRASDIDVACALGYNWPVHTGGPMFWADTVGLPRVVAKLELLAASHGEAFQPAQILVRLARDGGNLADL